jgi:hypothetical protein
MIEAAADESTIINPIILEANKKQVFPCKFYSVDPFPMIILKNVKINGIFYNNI